MNFTEKNVWTFGTIVCELLDDFFEMFVQSKIEKSGKSDLHFPIEKVWTHCQMIGFSSKIKLAEPLTYKTKFDSTFTHQEVWTSLKKFK